MSRIRHAGYEIKRPQIKNKALLPLLKVNAVYAKEETPPEGTGVTEWFLMTNEEVSGCGAAYEKAGQYIQRWKVERFHYVLKSGCKAWKLQERSMERMKALILMYPVISVFLLNLRGSRQSGLGFSNYTPSLTTGNCSNLWVKFSL